MGRAVIYLDANVIIRLVEGVAEVRAPLLARLSACLGVERSLATSRLSRLECRSKPLRDAATAVVEKYDVFFAGRELVVIELSSEVVERATELRAQFNLKTPDALHYASAVMSGAKTFLTGDESFARCNTIPVEIL